MTVDKIIEIWNKGLHVYHGNYEKYLQQKAERRAQLEAAYRNQRDQIEHLEAFINRFAIRRPRRSRCRAASRSSKRSSASRFPQEEAGDSLYLSAASAIGPHGG